MQYHCIFEIVKCKKYFIFVLLLAVYTGSTKSSPPLPSMPNSKMHWSFRKWQNMYSINLMIAPFDWKTFIPIGKGKEQFGNFKWEGESYNLLLERSLPEEDFYKNGFVLWWLLKEMQSFLEIISLFWKSTKHMFNQLDWYVLWLWKLCAGWHRW